MERLHQDGCNIYIQEFDPFKNVFTKKKVSAMDFYRYRMMIRPDQLNSLLMFRQLSNQYWVDMGAKMITGRLNFIRNSQKQLRVDSYIHLKDSTVNDGNPSEMGQLVILPSYFTGGPRYMHEKTQDRKSRSLHNLYDQSNLGWIKRSIISRKKHLQIGMMLFPECSS